uniref:DUF1214 domain-containing protein n=2 Tax=Aplanochytrium stocchinoi TaxID=215587 RepID=A0A7S3LSC8_9STRA
MVYYFSIEAIPLVIFQVGRKMFARYTGGKVNYLHHLDRLLTHEIHDFDRPAPFNLHSVLEVDVSRGPVRVTHHPAADLPSCYPFYSGGSIQVAALIGGTGNESPLSITFIGPNCAPFYEKEQGELVVELPAWKALLCGRIWAGHPGNVERLKHLYHRNQCEILKPTNEYTKAASTFRARLSIMGWDFGLASTTCFIGVLTFLFGSILSGDLKAFLFAVLSGFLAIVITVIYWARVLGPIRNGPSWHHNPLVGYSASGVLERAFMSLFGAFADDRTVQMYITANHDSFGRPLVFGASYVMRCNPIYENNSFFPATWWDITPYKNNRTLIPNDDHVYAISSETIGSTDPDGSLSLYFSPIPPNEISGKSVGVWAPTGEKARVGEKPEALGFLIRLFHPHNEILNNFPSAKLPVIERIDEPSDTELKVEESASASLLPNFWLQNKANAKLAKGFHKKRPD